MALSLLPHQAQALAWVRALSSRGLGSVLSDEPGTGKVSEKRKRAKLVLHTRLAHGEHQTEAFGVS